MVISQQRFYLAGNRGRDNECGGALVIATALVCLRTAAVKADEGAEGI